MIPYDDKQDKKEYAESIIMFLKYEAVRMFTPFAPVLKIIEPFCTDEYEPEDDSLCFGNGHTGYGKNKDICTDGVHLFYYTDELIKKYNKDPKELFSTFLHILIHIIALDIDRRKTAIDRWIFDSAVNRKNKKMMERFFPDFMCTGITDTHMWWDRLHPLLKEKGKSEKQILDAIRKVYIEAAKASGVLMADPGIVPGTDPLGAGLEADVKKIEAQKYDEILVEILSDGTGKCRESDEIFDYNWYQIGMEEYDSHPFIEAYEDSEKPDLAVKDIVIAIDTSGSCIEYGSGFISETVNTLMKNRLLGKGACIMECDADVHNVTFIRNHKDLDGYIDKYELRGGGGTDFRPVFKKIRELQEEGCLSKKINGLLYFSDGFGAFPDKEPDYPVWFAIPDSGFKPECPDYVGKIIITEKQLEKWKGDKE